MKLHKLEEYLNLMERLKALPKHNREILIKELLLTDLFFLMWFGLNRDDMFNQWLLDRCIEVQSNPDGYLDLWSRGHYKSSIITYGLTIFDILNDPETTIGIFSCTKPIAKQFLKQIKREFEENELLKDLFPEILYQNPEKESPSWSEEGIIVKRKSNPKECTLEAWGVVEGQPTSKHFKKKIYDDLITLEYVSTPEMIEKVTNAWALSLNLGSKDCVDRYIGTRYHFNDTYKTMMERGTVKPRIYAATDDGTLAGNPILLTREQLDRKYNDMGAYVFSAQMLQNPVADTSQGFRREWLRFYEEGTVSPTGTMNNYIIVDPANDKKKKSDYTAIWVIGLNIDNNYYIKDIVRDKLNLTERTNLLIELHKKYKPLGVAYEQYGKDSDIQHIEYVQAQQNYRFNISAVGGTLSKQDRIKKLVPIFEQGRIYLPNVLHRTNFEKKTFDLINVFIEQEYLCFPVSMHDDMLDALARVLDEDLNCIFPRPVLQPRNDYSPKQRSAGSSWAM